MDNATIARVLLEIADLLEIGGGNPFSVRAWRRAARTVHELSRPLAAMVEARVDLTTLPGIGREIARQIRELVTTGEAQRLTELEREMPATVGDLMRLDGVGPKRARKLYDALGIRTVTDLRSAIQRGAVEQLPGFGAKTVAAMLRSLDRPRSTVRFRLADAEPIIDELLEWLRGCTVIERVEVAGGFRRREETAGDITILALCDDSNAAIRRFTSFAGVFRIAAREDNRASVILASGLHATLHIVTRTVWGTELHRLTGNEAHVAAVSARIGTASVHADTEAAVYRAAGMAFVPPELREERGEVEAARQNALPRLIGIADIRGDLHMHSNWSDGRDSIETMVRGCIGRGYRYMAITDHSPAIAVARGLSPERLERQWNEIDRVRREHPAIRILRGMEVDILGDGSLDMPDSHLDRLDLVIVSVHSGMRMPKRRMTERILRALEHPRVDILAHPTGRLINEREPYDIDLEAVLRAAAERGVAVELNARPHRLDLRDVHVRLARDLGCRIVIDTDAHGVNGLRYMKYGIDQARRGWIEPRDVINASSPGELERWLRRPRTGRS